MTETHDHASHECHRQDCPSDEVPRLREMMDIITADVRSTRETAERTQKQVQNLQLVVIGDNNGNIGLVRKMDTVTDRAKTGERIFWIMFAALVGVVVKLLVIV